MENNIVLYFGGHDVSNFGDNLFPIIAKENIEYRVINVSPTGTKSVFYDSYDSIPFSRINEFISKVRSVIIGGGHLISDATTNVTLYSSPDIKEHLYKSFWVLPCLVSMRMKIPLIWNAPGMPRRILPKNETLFDWLLVNSDYISVRDTHSYNMVSESSKRAKFYDINIVPDTVSKRYKFYDKMVNSLLIDKWCGRFGIKDNRYFVVHAKKRYVDEIDNLSRTIAFLSKALKLIPVFLPLGPCHEDDHIGSYLNDKINDLIFVDDYSINLFVNLIAHSRFYIGSSLHGLIVSSVFKKKAVVVVDEAKTSFKKFSGFLSFCDEQTHIFKNWGKHTEILKALTSNTPMVFNHEDNIEKHWTLINQIIRQPSQTVPKIEIEDDYLTQLTEKYGLLQKD